MNDRSLQAIIWAYLQFYYGLCEETNAFTVLLCAIEYEVFHRYRESEAWDVMTLHELLLDNKGNLLLQRDSDSESEASILLVGIHNGLVEMKEKVVLIEWIGDWKNVIKLWKYDKGPLYGLVTPERDNKDTMYVSEYTVPLYTVQESNSFFICEHCRKAFNSKNQLLTHLKQQVIGAQDEPEYELKYRKGEENGDFQPFDRVDPGLKTGILYQNRKELFLLSDQKYWREIARAEPPENWRPRYKSSTTGSQSVTVNGDSVELVAVGVDIEHCMDMVLKLLSVWKG
jgi:hypothetical protein